jgi:RNA polymerase sigma-70 factor (ECF subfamily)
MMTRTEYGNAYQGGYGVTIRFLLSRGVPGDRAEEAAQAAWAKGWERRRQLRDPGRLVTWINTIALNQFRNLLRKQRPSEELPELATPPGTNARTIDLQRSLQVCRQSDRRILERHYLEGLTSYEIAQQSGCTPVAARVRLLRARRRLRHLLRPAS